MNLKPSLVKTIRSPQRTNLCVFVFFKSIVSFTFSSKLEPVTGSSVFVLRLWLFTVEPRWIFFVLASSHLAVDLTLDVPLDSFLFILTLPNILAHRFFRVGPQSPILSGPHAGACLSFS